MLFDERFKVEVVGATPNPQQVAYLAMHQCYGSNPVINELDKLPSERKCGEIIVDRLMKGDRGHYGPLEHPQIVFNCCYFPHSVMQQMRTHRIGVSFDVMSLRYNSENFVKCSEGRIDPEDVFYLRPIGHYKSRDGKSYFYDEKWRRADLEYCILATRRYREALANGLSEEHARDLLPYCVRQHFVMSCNARSLMHVLDLRAKPDAQAECQAIAYLIFDRFKDWMPEVASWYEEHRFRKARLAP